MALMIPVFGMWPPRQRSVKSCQRARRFSSFGLRPLPGYPRGMNHAPGDLSETACDREVAELLAHMDPLSQRSDSGVDPMLKPFLTWGGLYIAGCNGSIDKTEHAALASFVGESHLRIALEEPKKVSHFRNRLNEAITNRAHPLSALDINRIFTCLIAVSQADGTVDNKERDALHSLAKQFGIAPAYIDTLMENQA